MPPRSGVRPLSWPRQRCPRQPGPSGWRRCARFGAWPRRGGQRGLSAAWLVQTVTVESTLAMAERREHRWVLQNALLRWRSALQCTQLVAVVAALEVTNVEGMQTAAAHSQEAVRAARGGAAAADAGSARRVLRRK